ncbi:MAG: hypothetical protein ACHQ4G_11345 [Opitutales bacterium]
MRSVKLLGLLVLVPLALILGCTKPTPGPAAGAPPARHEHHPPHGGTPVVLGDEVYHVELVLDAAAGKLQAYVFDGELENFIRSSVPSFEIDAIVDGQPKTLVFQAVANPATGETVGDTSLFETQAEWLKTTRTFEGTLRSITIRGTTYAGVEFNFPRGNDTD